MSLCLVVQKHVLSLFTTGQGFRDSEHFRDFFQLFLAQLVDNIHDPLFVLFSDYVPSNPDSCGSQGVLGCRSGIYLSDCAFTSPICLVPPEGTPTLLGCYAVQHPCRLARGLHHGRLTTETCPILGKLVQVSGRQSRLHGRSPAGNVRQFRVEILIEPLPLNWKHILMAVLRWEEFVSATTTALLSTI